MTRKKLAAEEIVENLSKINSWERIEEKIFRRFNFKNFVEALDFVNRAGAIAEKLDHHPDIKLGYGYAEFEITTHDADGLTSSDFELASSIDELDKNRLGD